MTEESLLARASLSSVNCRSNFSIMEGSSSVQRLVRLVCQREEDLGSSAQYAPNLDPTGSQRRRVRGKSGFQPRGHVDGIGGEKGEGEGQ